MSMRRSWLAFLPALIVVSGAGCKEDEIDDPCPDPPLALGKMPDLDMLIGDTVGTSLVDYFGHPCQLDLSYTAGVADEAVAVSVSEIDLMTLAISVAESVPVRVIATDSVGKFAVHVFYVSVEEPEQPNRAPVVVAGIPDVTVTRGRPEHLGDVTGSFSDPDGDTLYFDLVIADTSIVKGYVLRYGEELTLGGAGKLGRTTITITVIDRPPEDDDEEALTASLDVNVTNVAENDG